MKLKSVIVAVFASLALLPGVADAQGRGYGRGGRPEFERQQDQVYDARREGRVVPLEQVIGQIQRRVGGRLLDAGLEERGGRMIYRVRWSTDDGRRIDFIVDAQSGAILSGG